MSPLLLERILAQRDAEPARFALHSVDQRAKGDDTVRSFTVEQLVKAARVCASTLRNVGVAPQDRVLLCLPNSEVFARWFLGAMWLGAVPVPLPSLSAFGTKSMLLDRVKGVIGDCKPKAIVADAGTASYLGDSGDVLSGREALISEEDRWAHGQRPSPLEAPPFAAGPNDTAFIQYTSGSTGKPRGVVVTHSNLAENLCASAEAMKLSKDDVTVSWLPLYHDMGLIGGLLLALYNGLTAYLLRPLAFMTRPSSWLMAMSRYRGTIGIAPNFAYSMCLRKVKDEELADLDLSKWRLAFNGAEPVDPNVAVQFGERFSKCGLSKNAMFPVYGLAEATLSVAFPEPGEPVHIDRVQRQALAAGFAQAATADASDATGFVSCGRAVPGHEISIRDPQNGALLEERRVGEIVVSGPSVTPYYFSVKELAPDRRKALRTGDLGYLADGRLYVVDRIKDLVIIAGRSYFPSDIERALAHIDGVRAGRIAVFGVHDAELGTEAVVVVAETRDTSSAARQRIQSELRRLLLDSFGLTPRAVMIVEPGTLPRTSSGKIMRRDSREAYLAGKLEPEKRSVIDRVVKVLTQRRSARR